MQAVLRDLGTWFWRLAPANPIVVRVVYAGGRRLRHLWIRTAYLTILAAIVAIGVLVLQSGETSLSDLAKNATKVFNVVSLVQLAMVCIIAPIFTAAAITQEKDSQTFNILLSTPLTNGQIVLGSLLSRLYFVFMLLLAGIPLFCIMMVYGGVTGEEIALSISIAGATALLTGSMAITISVIKIGTGRTIFTFYLAIALYLIIVYYIGAATALIPPEAQPAPSTGAKMSWLAAFHPFLSLAVVLGQTPAPSAASVAHYGFPINKLLAYPQYSYVCMTFIASLFLVSLSLFFVRRGAKEGEITWLSRLTGTLHLSENRDEQTRRPRHVWSNPISWRESVTGAAAGGGFIARYATLGVGIVIAVTLVIIYLSGGLDPVEARAWLFGATAIELAVALFIATATAATSMTREKESNTLELVLATPLTSRHIITGKIIGLVYAAGPILIVPFVSVALFYLAGLISKQGPVVNWESLLTLPILLVSVTALCCMLGLQASIKSKKTLAAVFSSMSIVILLIAIATSCPFAVRSSDNEALAAAIWPLTPFTGLYIIIDPVNALADTGTKISVEVMRQCRVIAFVAALAAAAIYSGVGWIVLRGMVRNFDMIIRKQSA
ncbi:MAG: ABC transporter permease subunit [Planctomycetia bacterium]|nr:ABC transporter permease subunit [Planctomycetia bacterium]MCC7313952.1 ABC transporter permease subunit [Planctomycetota bacterium]OQZ07032.1 MAG: hypothetical protein B6D36_01945 [Planctomycetes bacterium UTPLA1]